MHMSVADLTGNLLFCRHSSFERLAVAAPGAPALLQADQGTAKEYEKTARAVEKEPWRLHRAAAYIRQLIAEPPAPAPPSVAWLWHWAGRPAGGPVWPTAVGAGDFRGLGEAKTPGELAIKDGLAPRGKRMRITERPPPEVEAAPAVEPPPAVPAAPPADIVAAPAVPPPGIVDAPAVGEAAAALPPPPARRARPKAAASPLCPGLGCSKCRRSRMGCRTCKANLGWFEVAPGQWEHHT